VAYDRYRGDRYAREQAPRGISGGVIVALGLVLLAIGGFIVLRATAGGDTLPPASAQEIPATVSTTVPFSVNAADAAPPLSPSTPVTIEIPAIGVNAPIMALGLNTDGTVQVPPLDDHNLAGWYDGSVTPGQDGSAVILGHVDNYAGPSVFYDIKNLVQGDVIDVVRADGAVAAFTVDGVQAVPKATFPTAAVYGNVPYPALRLVTCGGPFDSSTGHYVDNIVVYAHLTGQATS
jgi:sortase (surface protein transpeptidase)